MILVAIESAVSLVCHSWNRSSYTEVYQKYTIVSVDKTLKNYSSSPDNIVLCLIEICEW